MVSAMTKLATMITSEMAAPVGSQLAGLSVKNPESSKGGNVDTPAEEAGRDQKPLGDPASYSYSPLLGRRIPYHPVLDRRVG